jgi:hypothetical protein
MSLHTDILALIGTQNEVFYFEIPSPDCTDVNIPMGVFIQSETQFLNSDPWSERSLFRTAGAVSANFKLTTTLQSLNTRHLLALKTSILIGYSFKIYIYIIFKSISIYYPD